MSQQDERRKKLIECMSSEVQDMPEAIVLKLAKAVGSPAGVVQKDLAALAAGQIPAGEVEVSPEARALAVRIRGAKTDDEIDAIMGDLAGLLLDRLVPVPEAKAVQGVMVGRRYFFAAIEAAKIAANQTSKGGRKIKVSQLPAVATPQMPPVHLMTGDQ